MSEKKLTVVDMFCGCGGLSRGFMDAGYEVLIGVDHEEAALKSFEANHGNAKALKKDLFLPEAIDEIIESLGNRKVDVLVGGPPCQGFSLAGPRNEEDERNTLYKAMVKLASKLKPKAVVIENVPGLATLYKGKAKDRIIKDFTELGYKMKDPYLLYAPEYGIPQIRKRIFFVGLLESDEYFEKPPITHTEGNFVNCEDAIGDLPSLKSDIGVSPCEYTQEPLSEYQRKMRVNSEKVYNHIGTRHTEKVIRLISKVEEGRNYKSLPDYGEFGEYKKKNKYNESLTRYHRERPSRTIDTGHRTHFHYEYNRVPTARENARLQSFPDDFIFYGNKSQQYRQIGNAVPPLLGYHLGKQLKKYIK